MIFKASGNEPDSLLAGLVEERWEDMMENLGLPPSIELHLSGPEITESYYLTADNMKYIESAKVAIAQLVRDCHLEMG